VELPLAGAECISPVSKDDHVDAPAPAFGSPKIEPVISRLGGAAAIHKPFFRLAAAQNAVLR
jgi:hypothetical protein